MTGDPKLDIDLLQSWIGRSETARDIVSVRLARELRASFDREGPEPAEGDLAPLAVHWCLAPTAQKTSALGPDGHPGRGGFLPPVPLPRRMWAGSALRLEDRLRIGDKVERRSHIADIEVKEGRAGTLCFVSVDHEISTHRGLAILERQNIVYRALQTRSDTFGATAAMPLPAPSAEATWNHEMRATPVLLFRYSALSFNAHRIHYDRTYAIDDEAYPGLVVHGPLQATLLLEYAAMIKKSAPCHFVFRGLRPLFDFMPFRLCAREANGGLNLWIQTGDCPRVMEADASW